MFSVVLGKDEDYVDKQKQHEIMMPNSNLNDMRQAN